MLAFIRFLFAGLLLVISHAFAATVQDEHGTFTLEKTPQRIVVLELSFADALAAVDVIPIGIADDNDAKRILPEVRAHLKPWQSVGTRAQPSLEAIAALKPDLIIADSSRHAGVYIALQQIAPVLLLKSRNETYAENLQSAAIIGEMVGKKREMQARLEQHKERMAQWASQLPKGTRVAFGTSREQLFNLHTQETWTGSVLASLGLNVPAAMAGASMPSIGLEQLLAVNPAWLLVAHYREESIVKRWQQDPLWQMLTAAQKQQVASVDSNTWARMRGIFAAERIAAIKHPVLLWGLPVAALIIIFWLSLFCYSAIPVSGADATRALLPGHTPTLPEALVQNLRLPRSLVAVLIGASLALAGTLLQTLTHNPMASPSLLGINSGAALAMALTSALSPTPIAGYSLSFIAACGGGVSWLLVMTAGGGFRHTQDRNKLILAGIALSAFCMGLTRITLLLAEDHAYGIFYWLAGGVSHARWQDVWQLLPVVVTAVPVVLLLANQLNLLNLSDSTAHTLGVNLTRLRLVINMLVLLLVGACVSVAGPVAFIGLLVPHLARFWAGFDQRNVLPVSMLLGATLMLLADVLARALAFPGDLPAGAVLALIGSPCFVWLVRRRG